MGKLQDPRVHSHVTPFLIAYNLFLPSQSTSAIHHLKGLDKFYLDHKKISGLLSISHKILAPKITLN